MGEEDVEMLETEEDLELEKEDVERLEMEEDLELDWNWRRRNLCWARAVTKAAIAVMMAAIAVRIPGSVCHQLCGFDSSDKGRFPRHVRALDCRRRRITARFPSSKFRFESQG
jgi:hypothetical protein